MAFVTRTVSRYIYNRGYHAIKGWWNQQADAACSQQMMNDEMKPGGQSAGSDQAVTMLTYTALSLYTESRDQINLHKICESH